MARSGVNTIFITDNPIVINAMVDNEKTVRMMKPFFHDTEEKMVATMSFATIFSPLS